MLQRIILFSLKNKIIVLLFTFGLIGIGIYSLLNIPIGAVPDITNNQVQVITTSRNLPTEEVERYLTYPVELEMANLPGVQEIRSISKFGLSVVTIVFDDDMGTYLPRQLINEKLKDVEDRIPQGFGSPFMGPISTGLGEIYQYILDVKPGYENEYKVEDLRTIQDWIVKRQLSGIPGVVEINTWGGFLKTYEVAVDPILLKAVNIPLEEIYTALVENNQVAGGGYIEKSNEVYFIRAEGLLKNTSDIENIVVSQKGATPIYIKDIAKVGFGSATRFGAITGNGEGEKVLGQVMMLKGANSKKVINDVKNRVKDIQKSLPDGVFINPFLERSDLIGRTTLTIAENLILGFLIVLFVVIFLLGSIRSGLVVASVIPLTLLFALTMMYWVGIDANLMSLGAIDFGIIIDGAVIIIEYIVFRMTVDATTNSSIASSNDKDRIDQIVGESAGKMMHSAIFGQVIIIIVFIPILVLAGIEGKMFRPMALTFCFALIGAMILCFTYVPVMASLFLKPNLNTKPNISDKFMSWVRKVYEKTLHQVLNLKAFVITISLLLLIFSFYLFSRLGGEFVPTLDEGDFVIQPVLKTGMSLAATVEMTTRIEKILKRFPEVNQVVSRIGAAEVPTDPMSMEESDVIITLNKKSEWTSASSKDELADVFKDALLAEIPGIEIEFTQPIEMRFNELISGARADLAIKLFGEDLDVLYNKSNEIERLIQNVAGAADISVEKIDGLPQMSIEYDKAKMAKYGVNIQHLNELIQMGFAGKSAGVIFEGESQFDLMLKYQKDSRSDINHLKNALVNLPSGQQLPLSTFATIEYTTGPAKISRDDTKRRVVIGVNVRGRDLQSVVDEIKPLIETNISLPSGYFIEYGGQFENLKEATQRLLVAVPVALLLIFILLYFAFKSVRDALIIYSAIPLATIGGIIALSLRGLPFSISAGVGFIALFGIAVLNGIVMIEHFKELKKNTDMKFDDLIVDGAVQRIRPVLLTAIAAAFGFLPMAISTSAGAEVQRPLATVVIGGLISATLLTLIVLPVLYKIFGETKRNSISSKSVLILIFLTCLSIRGEAQKILSLDEVFELAQTNNLNFQINQLEIEKENAMVQAVKPRNKTGFYYSMDRNNLTERGTVLNILGIEHSFKMPSVGKAKIETQTAKAEVYEKYADVFAFEIKQNLASQYDRIRYLNQKSSLLFEADSLFAEAARLEEKKLVLGASNILNKLSATQKRDITMLKVKENEWEIEEAYAQMRIFLQTKEEFLVETTPYERIAILDINLDEHPNLILIKSELAHKRNQHIANRKDVLPEINVNLFNGFDIASGIDFYPGFQIGVNIPLAKSTYKARERSDLIEEEIYKTKLQSTHNLLEAENERLIIRLENLKNRIDYYKNTVNDSSNSIVSKARKGIQGGEIDYLQFLLILERATQNKLDQLQLIHDYNQTVIAINFLLNK